MNPEWQNRYETAVAAAERAGRLALDYYNGTFKVELKADESPVTVADREAELLLRTTLLGQFPGDGFHGEQQGTSGFRWIIDPVDGTRNFVRGIPIWATLVGLEYRGEPVAGICVVPALSHTYRALRGGGAFRNDRAIHVSSVPNLREST